MTNSNLDLRSMLHDFGCAWYATKIAEPMSEERHAAHATCNVIANNIEAYVKQAELNAISKTIELTSTRLKIADVINAAINGFKPPVVDACDTLVDKCHGAAKKRGWWVDTEGNPIVDNPLTFPVKLFLCVSECVESFEGDRKDLMDDKLPHRKMREVEVADAIIRLFDLAGAYNFDIGNAVLEKMQYNETRADHDLANRAAAGGKKY